MVQVTEEAPHSLCFTSSVEESQMDPRLRRVWETMGDSGASGAPRGRFPGRAGKIRRIFSVVPTLDFVKHVMPYLDNSFNYQLDIHMFKTPVADSCSHILTSHACSGFLRVVLCCSSCVALGIAMIPGAPKVPSHPRPTYPDVA